jgi:hypothetical protein
MKFYSADIEMLMSGWNTLSFYSSDQNEPVDLGIFGLEKAEPVRTKPMLSLNPQPRQVIKALNEYQKACCRNHIMAAFRRAGIATYWRIEH